MKAERIRRRIKALEDELSVMKKGLMDLTIILMKTTEELTLVANRIEKVENDLAT